MIWRLKLSIKLNLLWVLIFLLQESGIKADFQPRIINGEEVKWNGTRYQISIRLEEIDRYFFGVGHLCGGSIINRYIVLTSAHCLWNANSNSFYPANKFSVVMGNLDRNLNDENSLKFKVNKIITGTHFNSSSFRDDLALMFLSQAIPENFTKAEVIAINENMNIKEGTTCFVTGWGLTEKQTYSRKLMITEVAIINRTMCSLNYGSDSILDGMLCAGYMSGKSDACAGDSGGPLVCAGKLVGLVSFGLGCAVPGYPGVYTNVAFYYNWIQNQTGLAKKNYQLDFNNTNLTSVNNTFAMGSSTANNVSNIILIIFIIFCNTLKFFKLDKIFYNQ